MIIILSLIAVGATILAIYERRSGKALTLDSAEDPAQDPDRAAYTKAEAIRAETQIANPPQAGGSF